MGGASDTNIKKEKWIQENLKERDYLRKLGVDERIIYKWILKKYEGSGYGMYWCGSV